MNAGLEILARTHLVFIVSRNLTRLKREQDVSMSIGQDEIFTAAIEGLAGHPATTAIGPRRPGNWEDDLAKGGRRPGICDPANGRGPGICEAAMLSASRASYMGTAGVSALAGDLARTVDAIECNCINTSEAGIQQNNK